MRLKALIVPATILAALIVNSLLQNGFYYG